ncbi:uncharacterized protein LOC122083619 [Macadamia integrifolia]|uniref:uncharacterized protein LOC122083619 n=1 Tax=Macadamia integrifolia TaxID=60698 RepID=UPI001C4FEB03|nr:uncharacterized protein LOC122083619 [Macadamia integrifolia]
MLKKMKRVAMDSSPSYMVDEEARARFKHQSLMQDYQDLFKDMETLKNQLQISKQKRSALRAEVRFLRQRYKHLVAVQSPINPTEPDPHRLMNPEIRGEPLAEKRSYREKEASLPNHSVFDLNQVSRGEDDDEFQVLEQVRMEKKLKNHLVPMGGGDEQTTDLNLPIFRDIGNGSSRGGKRKITWSDQVALRA